MQLGFTPAAHHLLLIEHLEALERGDIDKLMIWMPPGSAKSTYTSVLFPPWFMGRNRTIPVLGVSNTTELAERFSRRARNLVSSSLYRNVFGFGCSEDTKAAGSWENERGGEFFAAGVGSAIAGRRAKLGLIDDPIKSREEADSERIRQKHWDWYLNDFTTRLMPNASQIIIQCMVGDTSVTMADGSARMLQDIRPGDIVASYVGGSVTPAKVLNWANQGPDRVFTIRTISGTMVTANERHPFLVDRQGDRTWIRLKQLRVGDRMVRAIGESGAESHVNLKDVKPKLDVKASVARITPNGAGVKALGRHRTIPIRVAMLTYAIGMVSMLLSTIGFWLGRVANALFALSFPERTFVPIGAGSYASITATSLESSEDCSATIATLLLDTVKQSAFCSGPLNTFEITLDSIVEIRQAGSADVFDIQVEGSENFIANGLLSHNTRWHEDDLSGRILERDAPKWTVVKLPMEAVLGDPMHRQPGERLWPEWFTQDMVDAAKQDVRAWNALYQQDPAPEDGDYFKREWFNDYTFIPEGLHIYGASDYAVSEGQGDYTEHGIFGFDFTGCIYVLDWWCGQTKSDTWIETQCNLIAKWKPLTWFGEAGPIQKAIEPYLKKRMQERNTLCRLEWLPSIHDKVVRARAFQAKAAMGNVYVPAQSGWRTDLLSQLMRFPAGKYDDAVDVCSLIGRGLEHARVPEAKKVVVKMPQSVGIRRDGLGWMS